MSVTDVAAANDALQLVPHEIPAGLLVTVPPAELLTVSAKLDGSEALGAGV